MIPYVLCPSCNAPTLLPPPIPSHRSSAQPPQPRYDWMLKLACPECGLGYSYSVQDVRWRQPDRESLNTLDQTSLASISSECAEGCPGVRILWHTRVGMSADLAGFAELQRKVAEGFFHGLICPLGHPIGQIIGHGALKPETGRSWWKA
jgi:hypothetical protein